MGVRRDDPPAPRYERTGEIDRSGPYERRQYDQSGPLSAPLAYDRDDRPGSYDESGTGGHWERGPRYERTGEVDHSGAYYQQQAGYGPGAQPGGGLRAQPAQPGRAARYERPDSDYGPPQHGYGSEAPDYRAPSSYARPEQPASWDQPAPQRQPASYDGRSQAGPAQSAGYAQPAQYREDAGYAEPAPYREPAGYAEAAPYGPGTAPSVGYRPPAAPAQYGPPSGYAAPAQYGPPSGYAAPGQYGPPSGPAPAQYGPPGGYDEAAHQGRSAQFDQDRAVHYASFADQDASYTRPRPPAARDHFDPQDETDPLNIVALNTGNRW
jgi:hypothetical protein